MENKEATTAATVSKKKDLMKHLVNSSNLEWISYDEEEKKLYIQFRNGSIYEYYDVPENIFTGLLGAGSHGRYFWMKIRDKFDYKKLN